MLDHWPEPDNTLSFFVPLPVLSGIFPHKWDPWWHFRMKAETILLFICRCTIVLCVLPYEFFSVDCSNGIKCHLWFSTLWLDSKCKKLCILKFSLFIKLLFQYLLEYELEEELDDSGKMESKDTTEDVGDQSDSST